MGSPRWNPDTQFKELELEPEFDDRFCAHCERFTYIYEHRDRRLFAKDDGPVHVVSKLAHCPDIDCPGHAEVIAPIAEMNLSPPHWMIDWKLFLWMGHRRFARSWSVPQIRSEIKDSWVQIPVCIVDPRSYMASSTWFTPPTSVASSRRA